MRNKTVSITGEKSTLCRLFSPALDNLPPIFDFQLSTCQHPDVIITAALLSTLKKAVETYFDTNICVAALTLDDKPDHDGENITYTEHIALQALHSLGLQQAFSTLPAPDFIVREHILPTLPASTLEEPWTVLAVDYSVNWFSVGLYYVDEVIKELDPEVYVEGVRSTLGVDVGAIEGTLSGLKIRSGENDDQLDDLKNTLKHLFANPPDYERKVLFSLPENIDKLLVYGDGAKGDALNLLSTMLDAHLIRDAHVSTSVFDGMERMASTVYRYGFMNDLDRHYPPSWCEWRSKFYRADYTHEL